MTDYPEVKDFPMLARYCSLQDQLFTVKEPESVKQICWTMITYTRPAMEEMEQYNAQMLQATKEHAEYYEIEYREPHYMQFVNAEPFKRYAIINEREGNLSHAIWACQQAIAIGLTDDWTKAGMKGRLEKLFKRYNEQCREEKKNT
jgi:hypothetical protein